MSSKSARGSIALGGLTPLLDLLFLLLFALLTLSDAKTAEPTELVRVVLPAVEPGAEPGAGPARRLVLEIDAASSVRLAEGDVPVRTPEELDRALAAALDDALPEEVVIELQADADARHGVAVELLQHLRLRGFVAVQLVAQGRTEPNTPFGAGGGGERR